MKTSKSSYFLQTDRPRVGDKVAARRMRPSGHCQRHPYLVLWEPTHGHRSRERPKSTLDDILKRDADVDSSHELEALTLSRLGCGQLSSKWRIQGRGPGGPPPPPPPPLSEGPDLPLVVVIIDLTYTKCFV